MVDKDLVKKTEDNRISSKVQAIDFRKFIFLTPEMDKRPIFELIKKSGFTIFPLNKEGNFFTLDALNTPVEKAEEVKEQLENIKDEIKRRQLQYYDKHQDEMPIDTQILNLISKFLSDANQNKDANPEKLRNILSSVFEDLYLEDEEDIRFLDPQTIDHLTRATVAKKVKDAQIHLNQALVNILVQIRKLAILWFFKSISLDMYNLRTDRTDIYKLQENKEVIIGDNKYEVIPLTINNKQYRLAFSEAEYSLTTFDLGKDHQNLIAPIMAYIFIDKASLDWRLKYSTIIIKAISRLKEQTLHQIKNLQLDYDKVSVEELLVAEKNLGDSFEFLYQLLFKYRNRFEAYNQQLRRHYLTVYTKQLQGILGGAISTAVRKVTPLELLDKCDGLVIDLKKTTEDVSQLKFDVLSVVKDLIKQKKDENPTLFKKAVIKLQEIGENIVAKTLAELIKGNGP